MKIAAGSGLREGIGQPISWWSMGNNKSCDGTVEFSSEIAKSLNFTAEHTENAKAPESLNNDWNRLKTLRTLRSPR